MQRWFKIAPGIYACTFVALFSLSSSRFAAANERLADAAMARTQVEVRYDGSYRAIPYPGGDVPAHTGVCTDVVVRAYRALGIDLQRLVHEDMRAHFSTYPKLWNLTRPDRNIDHRRVPNLEHFFSRNGQSLPTVQTVRDHQPGDIISWRLANGLPHIGVVGPELVPGTQRYYIVHNIGAGPQKEDVLTRYRLNGHYRYGSTETLASDRPTHAARPPEPVRLEPQR